MSIPILDLEAHENGARAAIRFAAMSAGERLSFLGAALSALFTGEARIEAPHARTMHRGSLTRLRFDDRIVPVTRH